MKTLTSTLLLSFLLSFTVVQANTQTMSPKRDSLQVVKHKKLKKKKKKAARKNNYWTTKRFKLKVTK